jgi:hypothetical protein
VENHREVLARARYRRKREIELLVAELAPARDVPELVEPLRPAVQRGLAPSTWASLLAGNEGWVRHLQTGDGPAQVPNVADQWHEALATTLGDGQSEATAAEASGFAQVLPRRSEGADAPAWETSSEGSDAPAREAANDERRRRFASARRSLVAAYSRRRSPPGLARDGGRCTFLDARGVRCRATRAIELHHEHPYALGGPHCAENITLRCRSHNELAAESDFGRELMRAMKHSLRPSVTK